MANHRLHSVELSQYRARDFNIGHIIYAYRRNWDENPSNASLYCCMYMNGRRSWVDMKYMSGPKYVDSRSEITEGLIQLMKRQFTRTPNQEEQPNPEDGKLIDNLMSIVSSEDRERLMEIHKESPYVKNMCPVCKIKTGRSNKCIHSDCGGMCSDCARDFQEIGGNDGAKCPSCDKTQTLTCPICTDEKQASEVIMGKHCSHSVCLKCFADSYRSGRTITKCPMCRESFH